MTSRTGSAKVVCQICKCVASTGNACCMGCMVRSFNSLFILKNSQRIDCRAVLAIWLAIVAMACPGRNGDSSSTLTYSAQFASFVSILVILAVGSVVWILALRMFQSWEGRKVQERYFWVPYVMASRGISATDKQEGYNGSQLYATTLH